MILSARPLALAALAAVSSLVYASPQAVPTAVPSAGSGAGSGTCNNSPDLCGRQYNKVTHMGAHDSSFLRDKSTGNSAAGNQFRNATVALDAGFRLLQTQVHKVDSGLRLCHSSCGILDAGPLDTWLVAVANWVKRNPNDVVTLLLVNSDKVPAADLATAMQSSGIKDLAYAPASPAAATTNWPTLGTMIAQGSRVVVFTTNTDPSPSFPYILPQFNHIFETPFEVTQLDGFNCTLDRPRAAGQPTQAIAKGYMGLANHFKYQTLGSGLFKSVAQSVGIGSSILIPDVDAINTVNSPASSADGNLGKHLEQCRSEWGQQPNFVLVDFWDRANPIEGADSLNGLTSTTGRMVVAPTSAAPRELGPRPVGVVVVCLIAASLWLL